MSEDPSGAAQHFWVVSIRSGDADDAQVSAASLVKRCDGLLAAAGYHVIRVAYEGPRPDDLAERLSREGYEPRAPVFIVRGVDEPAGQRTANVWIAGAGSAYEETAKQLASQILRFAARYGLGAYTNRVGRPADHNDWLTMFQRDPH